MIIKGVGGARPSKSLSRSGRAGMRRAASRGAIAQRLRYMSQIDKYGADAQIEPTFTNCAALNTQGIIDEMTAVASLRPGVTDPTRHVVFSLEPTDRAPTRDELQRMIDIYAEERGFKDAQYAAYVHTDGHGRRHPLHIHLAYNRVRPDGSLVPDRPLDMWCNRAAARRIENEMGFHKNPGRDTPWTGSNRRIQRERAQKQLPAFVRQRHSAMAPNSAKEEAEIFMQKLMRRIGSASRAAERNADQAARDLTLQVRTLRRDKIEARNAQLRRAEQSHQQRQAVKRGHGQGDK